MTTNVHKLKVKDANVNVSAVFNQAQYWTFHIQHNFFFSVVSKANAGCYDQ
jgi:hypothetical protein